MMRRLFPWALLCVLCLPARAQAPRIAHIDLYGNRKVGEQRIRSILAVRTGDPLPPSKTDLEEQIEKLPNVVTARLEAVCCDEGQATLFVGIEEKGAAHPAFRSPPVGAALLPDETVARYRRFLDAVAAAARNGAAEEDLTSGHPLSPDAVVREIEGEFLEYAAGHVKELREVLRDAADDDHRAMAATLIGYSPKKSEIIDDLQYAMQDPDPTVRSNAVRALGAIAVLAVRQPDLELKIAPTWFIELLNSLLVSDRYRAAMALLTLTDRNAEPVLAQLRERALPSLVEMAQWSNLRYALPAYVLLCRTAGLSQERIEQTWSSGDRQATILDLAAPKSKKKR